MSTGVAVRIEGDRAGGGGAITAVIARSESELVTRRFFKTELKAEIAALEKRLMPYGLGLAGLLFAALGFTGSG